MSADEIEAAFNRNFKEKIRIVGENASGKFSSMWTFVGGNDGFYFGSRSIFNAFKVSLHANNNKGYIAYTKGFFGLKKSEGWLTSPTRTALEWNLPAPDNLGATHAAVIVLPAQFMNQEKHPYISQNKALAFKIKPECALEIGIFLSKERRATLEAKLAKIGMPLFEVAIDNWLNVSIVVRSETFDAACLPNQEQTSKANIIPLGPLEPYLDKNLNAMLWNDPREKGTLQIIDVGGVTVQARNK